MNEIILAFITGLTTGGLSCLAVQGGLLASSLAHQVEQDLLKQNLNHQNAPTTSARSSRKKQSKHSSVKFKTAFPILLFLTSKLSAYTLLGALLGLAGSFLTFDPRSRAILLIAIGVFMVGNGLRMLNVHPIFRYFNLEPPKVITRYIRRTARNGTDLLTPLFLGALTVFIPCGVTQAMMAAALATGSPATGAALMFAFTLGTSPVFFLVAYLTMQIGARLESLMMRFVAVVVLILGLVTINSGLNLMASPISLSNLSRELGPSVEIASDQPRASSEDGRQLELNVMNNGYFPQTLHARANSPVTLNLITKDTFSCSRDFVIPALNYYQLLPANGSIKVDIPPQPPGTVMRFTCSMGMYTGQIVFDG